MWACFLRAGDVRVTSRASLQVTHQIHSCPNKVDLAISVCRLSRVFLYFVMMALTFTRRVAVLDVHNEALEAYRHGCYFEQPYHNTESIPGPVAGEPSRTRSMTFHASQRVNGSHNSVLQPSGRQLLCRRTSAAQAPTRTARAGDHAPSVLCSRPMSSRVPTGSEQPGRRPMV